MDDPVKTGDAGAAGYALKFLFSRLLDSFEYAVLKKMFRPTDDESGKS